MTLSFRDSCGIKAGTTNAAESMLWNSTTLNSFVSSSLHKVSPLAKKHTFMNFHFIWTFQGTNTYIKSVIQEKMQVWMNIMIKYFTLPISTALHHLDAQKDWNCYAPIQDIFHKNPIHLKKLVYRYLSILAPKHGTIADHYGHWTWFHVANFNQKMIVDGHVDRSQLWKYWKLYCN